MDNKTRNYKYTEHNVKTFRGYMVVALILLVVLSIVGYTTTLYEPSVLGGVFVVLLWGTFLFFELNLSVIKKSLRASLPGVWWPWWSHYLLVTMPFLWVYWELRWHKTNKPTNLF